MSNGRPHKKASAYLIILALNSDVSPFLGKIKDEINVPCKLLHNVHAYAQTYSPEVPQGPSFEQLAIAERTWEGIRNRMHADNKAPRIPPALSCISDTSISFFFSRTSGSSNSLSSSWANILVPSSILPRAISQRGESGRTIPWRRRQTAKNA